MSDTGFKSFGDFARDQIAKAKPARDALLAELRWTTNAAGVVCLPCGHPITCLDDTTEDDEPRCLWCEAVQTRDQTINGLRAQLHAKAC